MAQTAQFAGLGPLLYDGILQHGLTIPAQILEELQAAYYQVAGANTYRLEMLEAILTSLGRAGIPVAVLKGAALVQTVYGNPGLRPMADLDLLVPRQRLPEACQVLGSLGYRTKPEPPGHSFAYEARFSGEVGMYQPTPAGNSLVDVHWHLSAYQWVHHTTRIDMDALWAAMQPLALDGRSTLQLSPEDTLLHVCLHAAFGHGYTYLLSLIDIDRILPAYPDMDWELLLRRAAQFQIRVPVYYGLRISQELLDTPVPGQVLAALQPRGPQRWVVPRMVEPTRTLLGKQPKASGSSRYLLHLALVDGLPGYLRFLRYYLLPGDEWLALRYGLSGRRSIRLARLWHPFRVLGTMAATTLRRLGR
jgi:hypothetical protein